MPSRKTKLTKTVVDNAQPESKEYMLWDSELSGFGVRVRPTGRKVFTVRYRNSSFRQRRATLGYLGQTTLHLAREEARQILARVARGEDPQKDKIDARASVTMADLCERYMHEHALLKKKLTSIRSDETIIRNHLLPLLGSRKVTDIARKDIYSVHQRITKGDFIIRHHGNPGQIGKRAKPQPETANRVLALLSKMMNLAELWELRPQNSNPCKFIERNPENNIERYLSTDELARLGEAIQALLQEGNIDQYLAAYIRLLVLTGCRAGEILNLTWEEVDFERECLMLKDSKTGAKTVPLSALALKTLNDIPKQPGNPYVIEGRKIGEPRKDYRRAWHRIRKRASLGNVRLHDLRHTFASYGAGANLGLPIIGKLLGHSQIATTQRYAHLAQDPMRKAADQIAGQIAAAMDKRPAEVLKLR